MRSFFAFVIAFVALGPLYAETPAFDPRDWRGQHIGAPTQVLTIGSAHLAQLPKPVTEEMLEPLLVKLAAFKPDIITHERLSGEQCDMLKRYEARYPRMFDIYCYDTGDAEKATGLSIPKAIAAVEAQLKAWPSAPTASQRRHLTALFLSADDRASALVQWHQLPITERKSGDGINAALLKILADVESKRNESFDIAVALAVRLNLQRIYAVDDHTADSVQANAGAGLDAFLERHWNGAPVPISIENARRGSTISSGLDLLDYYRFMNDPETQRAFVALDYKGAMNTPSEEGYGRVYLAWWEVRNLRMVSNIRAAFGNKPGGRVLNIVGASHKPYYDAYLNMMSDVQLVDAEVVLQ